MISSTNQMSLLKASLDKLQEGYGAAYLKSDPLLFLHKYAAPRNQEIVGFLAAVFAYGHVPQINQNLQRILTPFPEALAEAVQKGSIAQWKSIYKDYGYRFQRRDDLIMLLWLLKRVLQDFGSIEASFLEFYLPEKSRHSPIRNALREWVRFLRDTLRSYPEWIRMKRLRGIYHLLPDPSSGSPCKRWNLYLRWMVRGPDGLDLGIWKSVATRHLILPLDTHTARICRNLRLTNRVAPSWEMAEEITQALRDLDPDDPVRYDFSVARLGILARCPKRMDRTRCVSCELTRICYARDEFSSGIQLRPAKRERSLVSRQRGPVVP